VAITPLFSERDDCLSSHEWNGSILVSGIKIEGLFQNQALGRPGFVTYVA